MLTRHATPIAISAALLLSATACTSTTPPQATAEPSPPVSSPTPDEREREIERALEAYKAYEKAVLDTARTGGSEESYQAALKTTTSDGPERERVGDLVRQIRENSVRLTAGDSRLVYERRDLVAISNATPPQRPTVTFSTCWDSSGLQMQGSKPTPFLRKFPTVQRVQGQWLVHDMRTEVVDRCATP